jgi:uncharacterized protein
MMKINVAQQLKEPVGSVRQVAIDELGDGGFPIRGTVRLLLTNHSILVNGELVTTVHDICSRCLDGFDLPLFLDIEEEYLITRDPVSGTPQSQTNEPGVFTIDENNILDLDEAARQYTLLAQPMKPICRENCAGLCPRCGCNLNYKTCDCPTVSPDSPWASLQKLRSGKKQTVDKERG